MSDDIQRRPARPDDFLADEDRVGMLELHGHASSKVAKSIAESEPRVPASMEQSLIEAILEQSALPGFASFMRPRDGRSLDNAQRSFQWPGMPEARDPKVVLKPDGSLAIEMTVHLAPLQTVRHTIAISFPDDVTAVHPTEEELRDICSRATRLVDPSGL